jgi:hypothetical protein
LNEGVEKQEEKNKNKTWRRWHEIRKMSDTELFAMVIVGVSPNLENKNKRQRQVLLASSTKQRAQRIARSRISSKLDAIVNVLKHIWILPLSLSKSTTLLIIHSGPEKLCRQYSIVLPAYLYAMR